MAFFVYSYFDLVKKFYPKDATRFFQKFSEDFKKEHEYDLRNIEHITLPEHNEDKIAKLYRDNKYRLSLSQPAFTYLMQFLESLPETGFKLFINIVEKNLDLRQVERGADDRFSFAAIIARGAQGQDMPAEDEGIPGHRPGNAVSSTDPNVGNNLATLKLGKLPMEKDAEEDVRAEVTELDLAVPPATARPVCYKPTRCSISNKRTRMKDPIGPRSRTRHLPPVMSPWKSRRFVRTETD